MTVYCCNDTDRENGSRPTCEKNGLSATLHPANVQLDGGTASHRTLMPSGEDFWLPECRYKNSITSFATLITPS